MFGIRSAAVRAITAGAMVVALAACGGNVDVAATGTGGESSASGTGSGGASVSSSSSGSGGAGGLPAASCAPGEDALVAATGAHGLVAFEHEGTWSKATYPIVAANQVATFEGGGRLGAFWIETMTDSSLSHLVTTADGASFDAHDVQGWYPLASFPLVTVGPSVLMGFANEGSVLAHYHSDVFDWVPYPKPAPFIVSSAVSRFGSSAAALAVGVGNQGQLCDTEIFAEDGGDWSSPHCRDEVHVFQGNDIPVAPPRAAALPNGDVVVVYHEDYVKLAATWLHMGVWSAPESIDPGDQSLDLAITATPAGDVIVGIAMTSGLVSAVRYVPGAGWGTPFPIEQMGTVAAGISAAPGICGDDAMIAYAAGSLPADVRVARVRGEAAEATTIASLTQGIPWQVSISTRSSVAP